MGRTSNISIIIPTIATADRATSLWRAIRSVTDNQEVPAIPIVVANGDRYDPALLEALKEDDGIRYFYLQKGNLPLALRHGAENIDTEYFGFLDDDDEYTPNALKLRLEPFERDGTVDAVISNGYRQSASANELCLPDLGEIVRDPLKALLTANWLASCGGLYRTKRFNMDWLDPEARYLEWTYFAFRLALESKIEFISDPTFVIHATPGSLSESDEYVEAHPFILGRILELNLPANIRKGLKSKLAASLHDTAEHYRQQGAIRKAWANHIRSILKSDGILRYSLYTRKLIVPVFTGWVNSTHKAIK